MNRIITGKTNIKFLNKAYWFTATTKTTSMSLGSQKGFMTDRTNEPPQ